MSVVKLTSRFCTLRQHWSVLGRNELRACDMADWTFACDLLHRRHCRLGRTCGMYCNAGALLGMMVLVTGNLLGEDFLTGIGRPEYRDCLWCAECLVPPPVMVVDDSYACTLPREGCNDVSSICREISRWEFRNVSSPASKFAISRNGGR